MSELLPINHILSARLSAIIINFFLKETTSCIYFLIFPPHSAYFLLSFSCGDPLVSGVELRVLNVLRRCVLFPGLRLLLQIVSLYVVLIQEV